MSFSVGIWIIGSLIWDKREHREIWRRDRLRIEAAIHVPSPIRYGRVSGERGNTYTMVFSNALLPSELGWALIVPCRCSVSNPEQLVNEAEALWTAEQSKASKPGRISAGWGAVGLLFNPTKTGLGQLQTSWLRRVEAEHQNYESFKHATNENAAIGSDGILSIPWPVSENGAPVNIDILLATATQPCLTNGSYATPETIAKAWKRVPKKRRYFDENRRAGITTAEDYRIIKFLGQDDAPT